MLMKFFSLSLVIAIGVAIPIETDDCIPGREYRSECNSCSCNDAQFLVCTRRGCDEQETFVLVTESAPKPVNQEVINVHAPENTFDNLSDVLAEIFNESPPEPVNQEVINVNAPENTFDNLSDVIDEIFNDHDSDKLAIDIR